MSELAILSEEVLEFHDAPRLIWMRVRDACDLIWNENPKLHDISSVIQSIHKYGFQELPKFDFNLPNVSGGNGAIKAGNGRIEGLLAMERAGYELPRGLAVERATEYWALPIIVGTDAQSLNLARAYAIDSNNLTMVGGDFTAADVARMWDNRYASLLQEIASADKLPVTVSDVDLDALINISFLDELAEAVDAVAEGDEELFGNPFVEASFIMRPEQREILTLAINLAKRLNDFETSQEALVYICERYIAEQNADS